MGEASTVGHRWRSIRRAALVAAATTAILTGPSALPARAGSDPLGWQSFLEQPRSSDVRPVSATVLSGSVSNARGVTSAGGGVTTLTVPSGGRQATILLDYGVEVEGSPDVDVDSVASASGPLSLSLAFTEARTYLRTPGSSALAAASSAGATTITVQPGPPRRSLTFAPDDTVTLGSPTEVDRIAAVSGYRNTGDTAFVRQVLPWLEGQLAYDSTLANGDGLIVTGPTISTTNGGFDWDFYDGAKTGVVTAFNELYYRTLRDLSYIETGLGNTARAAAYDQTANRVRESINAVLFNPASGTYYSSDSDHSTFAQDANALSVLFGVAPASRAPGIVRALRSLWGPHGSAPFSGSIFSSLISPYITAFEVEADYLAGDAADAERLLHLTWDQMLDRRGPFFTGTFWENIGADGTATLSRTSLAHGWASGPTPIMTGFVLGVRPAEPGYRSFTVAPHFGSLTWARGAVPTPFGRVFVRWSRDDGRFSLTVQAPPGTTGTIALPDGRHTVLNGGAHGAERTFSGRDRDDRTDSSGGD
ncbi:MAG: hypothetical protein E6J41_15225 [Chloroflexi bacterium]|nr:MAG: hypothetical protein E6J41_15225 [Chloroflexota bacterium]